MTLVPLPPEDVRARRRPLAILLVFATELAFALLIATPVHAWARRVWGAHPDGDAVLFAPGARDLMFWLGQNDSGLGVSVRTTSVLLLISAVLMQLALGALIASLAFGRASAGSSTSSTRLAAPRAMTALQVAVRTVLPLSGLLVLSFVAMAVVLGIGSIAAGAVEHGLTDRLGDARAFHVRLATLALFGALAAVVGVFVDLARAAIGREAGLAASRGDVSPAWTMMLRGIRTALGASRRGLVRATLQWAWRAALGIALIAAGYAAAQSLGGRGGSALIALFVIHQVVVLLRTALRASWLARAIGMIAPVQDAREEARVAGITADAPAPALASLAPAPAPASTPASASTSESLRPPESAKPRSSGPRRVRSPEPRAPGRIQELRAGRRNENVVAVGQR